MNKADIERSRAKRKQKGKSHETGHSNVEIFRWLSRTGMNKVNIGGVKTVEQAKGNLCWSSNIKMFQRRLLYLLNFCLVKF